VAGKNFGCGSAREQAVKCLKQKGVAAVVAKSISRIYYRNSINEGFLPIVCPEAVDAIRDGDEISVDLESGTLTAPGGSWTFAPFPPFVKDILSCGGLIASVRREVQEGRGKSEESVLKN
jgi:3-isopropylmalate/(R)-2-methylmalate dehydratase small subunit